MNHLRFFNITLLTVGVLASAWSGAQDLKGADVYGDWKTDKPGLTRWITAADVKKPLPAGVVSAAASKFNAALTSMHHMVRNVLDEIGHPQAPQRFAGNT